MDESPSPNIRGKSEILILLKIEFGNNFKAIWMNLLCIHLTHCC